MSSRIQVLKRILQTLYKEEGSIAVTARSEPRGSRIARSHQIGPSTDAISETRKRAAVVKQQRRATGARNAAHVRVAMIALAH